MNGSLNISTNFRKSHLYIDNERFGPFLHAVFMEQENTIITFQSMTQHVAGMRHYKLGIISESIHEAHRLQEQIFPRDILNSEYKKTIKSPFWEAYGCWCSSIDGYDLIDGDVASRFDITCDKVIHLFNCRHGITKSQPEPIIETLTREQIESRIMGVRVLDL